MGRDRWLGVGWPEEYGGRGFGPVEQFIFMNESWRAGAPTPFLSVNTVGQTIMQFGTQEQKDFFLPEDPGRRAALLDRLHRARRRHRPGVAHHQGRQGRRRVGDQRPEDLHLAGQLRRLHLAGRPHRPRRPEAPGHHDVRWCPPPIPGFSYSKIHTMVNASTFNTFYDDVRVPDVGHHRRAQRRLGPHRQPAQLRAGGPGPAGDDRAHLRGRRSPGPASTDHARRRAGRSTRSGCRSTWPGSAPASSTSPSSTGRWRPSRPPASRSTRPTPAPSRCSAPSSSPRPTGCSPRSSARPRNLADGSPGAALACRLDRGAQGTLILTFGGGVNEIQRDLIAMFGLGMPRMPRM